MKLEALPEVARGRLHLDSCVATRPVHEGPIVRVVRWHCRHDGDALRAERTHTAFVFTIIQSGACRLHDGRWNVTVDPVTSVIHRPGAYYRTTHPFGLDDTGWSVAVREDVARELLERAGLPPERWDRPSMTVSLPPAPAFLQPLILFGRARHGGAIDPVVAEEICIELFQEMIRSAVRTAPEGRRPDTDDAHRLLAEKTRAYLNAHYSDSLRLDEIGRSVGASPAHLCRLFRRHAGVPIRVYLERLRMAAALDAVLETDAPLSRIAVDAGFYSHSHLTATFAGKMGVPPGEVRRRLRGAGPPPRN